MARVTVIGNGLALDEGPHRIGRGGYLHRADDCLSKFVRSRVKEFRSLQRAVAPDERLRIAELIRGAAGERRNAGIR
jgi:predicted RNA-binding protein YlxR (DUF448 family)